MAARATIDQFKKRLSPAVVTRIYDDNNDGTPDDEPIQQCLDDAGAKVDSYLDPIGLIPNPMPDPPPREIVRLELDIAQAYACQRFPEAVRQDGEKLMKQAEADLDRLRKGVTSLGPPPAPGPAANSGGAVFRDDRQTVSDDVGGGGRTFEDMGDY